MTTRYHYDLYPRTDPRDGARVTRFAHLQRATYRDVIGVGSGVGVIRSSIAEADHLDPLGEQYVRVIRRDTTAETEAVVGGFWINNYKHDTAVSRQTKRLTFSGAGTMAYLARARMWNHSYLENALPGFIPQDPYDDIWRLWNQGNAAGGDYLGAMLWRVVTEALNFRSGSYTHKHKDGLVYTDSHTNDRLESAIPLVMLGFDQFDDSDGNPWTATSGEFTASVNENLLAVIQRLMQAGLYIEMDPDTFELRAWQNEDHRRDRTGGAWGTNVVRFQAPTDGTIATGNMLSDSDRELNSHLKRSIVLAGGNDIYKTATGTTDIPWEGAEHSTVADEDALEQIALTQITAREEAADAGSVRMKLGTTPLSGRYRPWEECRLDDLVTLDTGSGVWDYTEDTYPVAGLRIELQKSGAWWAWAELGASQPSLADRKFTVSPVGAHSHPPNPELCRPIGDGGEPAVVFRYTSNSGVMGAGPYPAPDAGWDNSPSAANPNELTATPADTRNGGMSTTSRDDVMFTRFAIELDTDLAAIIAAGGATILMHARARTRAGIGIDESLQDVISQMCVKVTQGDSSTIRGTALAMSGLSSSAGSAQWNKSSTYRNMEWPAAAANNVLSAVAGTAAGDFLVIEVGSSNFTTISATTGSHIWFNDRPETAGDLPNDLTTTANLRSWIQLSVAGSAGTGDGHPDLIGTSVRASRCDHRHDVHRDRAPTMADDGSIGYHLGTIWAQVDDLDAPTEILGVWYLMDATTDAAVWLSIIPTPTPSLVIEEEDGDPSGVYDIIRFPNDALTDNGDGSVSVAGGGGSGDAEDIAIADAGSFYTGTDVEAALQELGPLEDIAELVGRIGDGIAATFVGANAGAGGLTITVNKPGGTADGDLVIFCVTGHNVVPNAGGPAAGGGAWTERLRFDEDANEWVAVYTKIAASEGASWTITTGSSSTTLSRAWAIVLRGPTTHIRSVYNSGSLSSPYVEGTPDGHMILVWISALAAGTLFDIGFDPDIVEHYAERGTSGEGAVMVASRPTRHDFPQQLFTATASGMSLAWAGVLAMIFE